MKRHKKLVALLVALTFLFSLAAPVGATTKVMPTDAQGTKYEDAFKTLFDFGVFEGSDGKFDPNGVFTRAQMAKIAVILAGKADVAKLVEGNPTIFADAKAGVWYTGWINVASALGIMKGDAPKADGTRTFRPGDPVSYKELATLMVRTLGFEAEAEAAGGYPAGYVKVATDKGLLKGVDFAADSPAKRGEVALLTSNAIFAEAKSGKAIAQTVFGWVPPSPVKSLVISPASANIAVGTSQAFTVKGLDKDGKEVEVKPTWTATGGVIDAAGNFAATQAGAATVTAKVGDLEAKAAVTVFGAATKLVVNAPAELVANGKSKGTVTATAVDANGNVVPTFDGTINFVLGGVTPATASVKAVNGVASVEVKANASAGTYYVAVSSAGLTGANTTVKLVAQKLTSVKLVADPATLAADAGASTTTIRVIALDQEGQAMPAPTGLTVKLTSSNKDVANFAGAVDATVSTFNLAHDSVNNAAGEATLRSTSQIGSVAVTGAVTAPDSLKSVPVTSTAVSTMVVGSPYKLAIDTIGEIESGKTKTIVVRVLDVNGNQVTGGTAASVALTANGTTVGSGNVSATGGRAEFSYTGSTAGSVTFAATGTYTYNDITTNLVKAEQTATVVPGGINRLVLEATPATVKADGVSTSVLKVTVQDAAGNTVKTGSIEVKISKLVDNGAFASIGTVTLNTVEGVATLTITSTTKLNTDTFQVTTTAKKADGTSISPQTQQVTTAIFGAPNKLEIGTNDIPADFVKAGKDATVKVNVKDFNGNTVTNDNGRLVTLTVKDADGVVVGTFTGTTANGVASIKVNLTKSGTYTVSATAAGLTNSNERTVTYIANDAVALAITATPLPLAADGVSQADITIKGKDAYGNDATVANATAVTLTASNSGVGTLGSTSPAFSNNSATTTFRAGVTPGSVVITASASGLTSASVTINTLLVGQPAKLAFETIKDTKADGTTQQVVKVTVLDPNGNRVTSATNLITLAKNTEANATIPNAVYAVKGQATFNVTNTKAETVTYTATATGLTSATATGKFVAGAAYAVAVEVAPTSIVGNGSSVATVTAKVVDANNNLVDTFSGKMKFSIPATSGNVYFIIGAASDGTLEVDFTGGKAVIMVQSKDLSALPATVQNNAIIKAETKINDATKDATATFTVTKP